MQEAGRGVPHSMGPSEALAEQGSTQKSRRVRELPGRGGGGGTYTFR